MKKAFALVLFLSTAHGAMDDVRIYMGKLTLAINGKDVAEMTTYSTALTTLILEGQVVDPISNKPKDYGFRNNGTPEEIKELYSALKLISQATKTKDVEFVTKKMSTKQDDLSSVSTKRQGLEPQVITHRELAQKYFKSLLGTPLAEPKNIPEASLTQVVKEAIGCLDKGKETKYKDIITDLQAISKNSLSGFENLKSSFFAPMDQLFLMVRSDLDSDALKALEILHNNSEDLKKILDHVTRAALPSFKDFNEFNEFDKTIKARHKDPLLKITGKEAAIDYLKNQPNAPTYKDIISSLEPPIDTDAIKKLVKMAGETLDFAALEALDMLPGNLVNEAVERVNLYDANYTKWPEARKVILKKIDERDLDSIKETVKKILTDSQELTEADIKELIDAKPGFDGLASTLLRLVWEAKKSFEVKKSALNALKELNKTRQGRISVTDILVGIPVL